MIYRRVEFKNICEELKESEAYFCAYVPDNSEEINIDRKRPTIIICPGGGYGFTSDREAEPVALRFMAEGYNAIVLRYSISPIRYPNQLLELSVTVAYARKMSEEWNVDINKIILCGFSAGGHLAGTLGTKWNNDFIKEALDIRYGDNKPNAMILSYPVISAGEFGHRGSFDNLLGKEASEEERDKLSLEKQVSENTPPTFLWHTFDDNTVPVNNSLLFAEALTENNIQFEMHIFPKGVHGLSLCEKSTAKLERPELVDLHVGKWFKLAIEWINKL